MNTRPPKIPEFLIKKFLPDYTAAGDFAEVYAAVCKSRGRAFAAGWYWFQLIVTFKDVLSGSIYWSMAMIKNYLTVAIRNLMRNKVYSFINVFGLATGMAFFILAAAFAAFEFSYSTFHEDADRIYTVLREIPSENQSVSRDAGMPLPFRETFLNEFPEVESGTSVFRSRRRIIGHGEDFFYADLLTFADPNFFDFFSFELILGGPKTVLSDPYSIVLTEGMARKYFGDENPIGKTLTVDNKIEVMVTGIVKKLPPNTGLRFNALLPTETAKIFYKDLDSWDKYTSQNFIRLNEKTDPDMFTNRLQDFKSRYFTDEAAKQEKLILFPLLDLHSKSESMRISSMMYNNIPYEVLFWYLAMAIVLLSVVSINFMNLSTARYTLRIKEVGLRKVIGANRSQLIKQYIGESVVLSALSLPVALIMYEFLRPAFIAFMGFEMDIAIWHYPVLLTFIVLFNLFIGFISGCYPAFYLSKFTPVQVLSGNEAARGKSGRLRKTLVVAQFVMSIMFIIFTLVIRDQLGYLLQNDFGFDRSNVQVISLSDETREYTETLRQSLTRHSDITLAASTYALPMYWNEKRVIPEGFDEDTAWKMHVHRFGPGFIEAFGMTIIRGRSLSEKHNDVNSLVINETAVSQLGWRNPIGKQIKIGDSTGTVVGVIKDYLFTDAHSKIPPTVVKLIDESKARYIIARTVPGADMRSVKEYIQTEWNAVAPGIPLICSSMDSYYRYSYSYVTVMSNTFGVIGFLAVLISCLGLIGMVSFTIGRRTREIGIRKVLGASVSLVVKMLLKDFLWLVIIANLISWPLTYYSLKMFLPHAWHYSTDISMVSFAVTGMFTVITALIAVMVQTVRAARANPADSLRTE